MASVSLDFGKDILQGSFPDGWTGGVVESSHVCESVELEEMVRLALLQPVGSPPLRDIVCTGEKVCIVFSDITRSWQRTDLYLPLIVEELEKGGISPDDITLLCALGTHRKHTTEEMKRITGPLFGKYRILEHDCDDRNNLVCLGSTRRGTRVELNKAAVEADRLVLTGGIVFHLMAGYSGGRKSLLPGISSRRTIMENHALSLSPEKGKGSHPLIGCDRLTDNPLHEDLMEAQEMLPPDFIVNIIPGKSSPGAAVAGHYIQAHAEGCRILREHFLIPIPEKRNLVIASAGGFPGDINFYQSVKAMINAAQALQEGGTMVLLSRSQEGLGNPLMEEMISQFSNMLDRELFLRDNYSIGRFIAYYGCELASRFSIVLVTDMDEPALKNAGIVSFKEFQAALDWLKDSYGPQQVSYWILPDAAHSFPRPEPSS